MGCMRSVLAGCVLVITFLTAVPVVRGEEIPETFPENSLAEVNSETVSSDPVPAEDIKDEMDEVPETFPEALSFEESPGEEAAEAQKSVLESLILHKPVVVCVSESVEIEIINSQRVIANPQWAAEEDSRPCLEITFHAEEGLSFSEALRIFLDDGTPLETLWNEVGNPQCRYYPEFCSETEDFWEGLGETAAEAEPTMFAVQENASHEHRLSYSPGKPASCEEGEILEHWHCSECGKDFMYDRDMKLTELDPQGQGPAGHKWRVSFTWAKDGSACKAEGVCLRDPEHRIQAEAMVTSVCTKEPTESSMGKTTYFAEFGEEWAQNPPQLVLEDIPSLAHTHEMILVPAVAPSEGKPGTKAYYRCSLCGKNYADPQGKTEIEDLDQWMKVEPEDHVHVLNKIEGTAPTCEQAGTVTHWVCRSCGKQFADAKGEQELAGIQIPALEHSWSAAAYEWSEFYDCCKATQACTSCGKVRQEESFRIIGEITREPGPGAMGETTYTADFDALWARGEGPVTVTVANVPSIWHTLEAHGGAEATCEEEGLKPYWHCTVCKKNYQDAACTLEIPNLAGWIAIPKGHKLTHIPEKKATCTENGVLEYWHCERCGGNFLNAGSHPTSQTIVPKLGHAWKIDYAWDGDTCTARRICARGCGAKETEAASAVQYETAGATCTSAGQLTYVADFHADWAKVQLRNAVSSEAYGHEWGPAEYLWSGDHKHCTARRYCLREEDHVETANAVAAMKRDLRTGDYIYTAQFSAGWARTQTERLRSDTKPQMQMRKSGPELPSAPSEETQKPQTMELQNTYYEVRKPTVLTASELDQMMTWLSSDHSREGVSIAAGPGMVVYDRQALQSILQQAGTGEPLELQLEGADPEDPDLNVQQRKTYRKYKERGRLYSITLRTAGKDEHVIESFQGGLAAVTVPCLLEKRQQVQVSRLEKDGSLTPLPSVYVPEEEAVTFYTASHSFYLMTKTSGNGESTWPYAFLGLPLLLLPMGIFWTVRRRKQK